MLGKADLISQSVTVLSPVL